MRRRRRFMFLAVALIALTGLGTAIAIAANGNRPRTQPVAGTFRAAPVNVKTQTCTGEDGVYLEIDGKFAGTIVSTDPRMTGDLEFQAHALVNLATGLGTFEGNFHVRPATRVHGAHGRFYTVVTEGSLNHGFAVGKVGSPAPGEGAENFFSRFQSVVDPALNVTGHFGGAGDPRTPAVVQSGQCPGVGARVP